jgi:phospholipid-translocating ATPase
MQNSGKTPSKQSKINRQLNPLVLLNFFLLIAMCATCALIAAVYGGTFISESAPFSVNVDGNTPIYQAFVSFFACMIIFNNIIPISLYICIDMARTAGAYLMSVDVDM